MANEIRTIEESDERVVSSRKASGELLEIADSIIIDSSEMNEIANDTLSSIHSAAKELEARKSSVVDPLNAALKATRALFRPAEDALETAKVTLKRKIGSWYDAQETKRRREEAEAHARQQKQIEEANAAAAAALENPDATALEREEAIEAAAAAELAPPVAQTAETSTGDNAVAKRWKAEIVSLPELLRHIASDMESESPRFDKTVEVKIGQLQKFAAATNGSINIPGVRFYRETSIIARAQ